MHTFQEGMIQLDCFIFLCVISVLFSFSLGEISLKPGALRHLILGSKVNFYESMVNQTPWVRGRWV